METPADFPLQRFKTGCAYGIDPRPYFEKFTKQGWSINSQMAKFDICLFGLRGSYAGFWGVWADAPSGLVLVKKDVWSLWGLARSNSAVAVISFETDGAIVNVKQIQGVRRCRRRLKPLRWEKLLLQLVVDWARENGFARVTVAPSRRNGWLYLVANHNNLKLKYDITAKRLGFTYEKATDSYVRILR